MKNATAGTHRPIKLMSLSKLMAKKVSHDWLVDSLLRAGRPTVIAGPMKSFKSSVAIDLALSLVFQKKFLTRFTVPSERRVALFSGETDLSELHARSRRIGASRGIDSNQIEEGVKFTLKLPELRTESGRSQLTSTLQDSSIEVAIIDPLYMALASELPLKTDSLLEMGYLLKQIGDACLAANATPIFVHHTIKSYGKSPNGNPPPVLRDLAFAGIAEYVRQWILLGHCERFDASESVTRMHLVTGSNDGPSESWTIQIDEGRKNAKSNSRKWDVSFEMPQTKPKKLAKQLSFDDSMFGYD